MAEKATATSLPKKDSGTDTVRSYLQFFGGMVRDDKSTQPGAGLDVEELDILENANYVRPTQILSADTIPATTAIYAYAEDAAGVGYAVGHETADGNGYLRILQNTQIATGSPGGWTTVLTAASSSEVESLIAAAIIHYVLVSTVLTARLYFVLNTNVLYSWDNSAGLINVGTLPGVTSNTSQVSLKEINGMLYIVAGGYVSTVDNQGNFTANAFVLPYNLVGVDIVQGGEYWFILCSFSVLPSNQSIIIIWDGVSPQYTDQIPVPMGGPQWVFNFKNTITVCCASGGIMKLFKLNTPATGAICTAYPNILLKNVQAEGQSELIDSFSWIVPISPAKTVFVKDDILYFGVWKTDASGIYALGQLDGTKPFALWLAKRFNTTNYANHLPLAAHCYGSKIFASYSDGNGGTATKAMICDPAVANRSSLAFFQSVWDDIGRPQNLKDLRKAYLLNYPIPSGCSLSLYVAGSYGSPVQIFTAGGIIANILNAVRTIFRPTSLTSKITFQWKVAFTSNGATSPILTGVALRVNVNILD